MTRSEDAERFAAQVRALKERAGLSYEELARRSGVSGSSLHRYCSGAKVPTSFGVVHSFATACGASSRELQDLHRLWALADATRSSSRAPDKEIVDDAPPAAPVPRASRTWIRQVAIVACVVTVAVINMIVVRNAASRPEEPKQSRPQPSGTTAPVTVFNIEKDCRGDKERLPGCSIGLAANPRLNYDAHNVVTYRVWDGDVLTADCIVYDGDQVRDESGNTSTRWFRVRVGDVPGGYAWLSGIRTRDNPPLPTCAT